MTIDNEMQNIMQSVSAPDDIRDAAKARMDAAIRKAPTSPSRRFGGRVRNAAISITGIAAAIAIGVAVFPDSHSEPQISDARSELLAVSSSKPVELVVNPGQYIYQKTLERSLSTNGHEFF